MEDQIKNAQTEIKLLIRLERELNSHGEAIRNLEEQEAVIQNKILNCEHELLVLMEEGVSYVHEAEGVVVTKSNNVIRTTKMVRV